MRGSQIPFLHLNIKIHSKGTRNLNRLQDNTKIGENTLKIDINKNEERNGI